MVFLPADPRFAVAWDKIPQVDEGDPDRPEVDLDGLSDCWVQSRYEIVTTDGATAPGKPRPEENHTLRRSGFDLFYGMVGPSKFVRFAGHLLSAAVPGSSPTCFSLGTLADMGLAGQCSCRVRSQPDVAVRPSLPKCAR